MKLGRSLLVVALVITLLMSATSQKLAVFERQRLLRTPAGGTGGPSLASMDSYALALLLGGMRGPLVMFLWMQSEAQKEAKDLEGVETQIEWIRLLQPEFDTVHLFQIWNKAYNISVQMASLANKYAVILDALDYARSVEKQRPDNVNILMSMASIFNDKFANSHEKDYYRKRIREDSMYRPMQKESRAAGVRPTRFDSILDEKGYLRPELIKPRISLLTPGKAPTTKESLTDNYDGSELQYAKKYQPYPYGVPAYALAYNYYQRCKALQNEAGQRHIQITPIVVDSRPPLVLRAWADEEWELAARAEDRLLGLNVPVDRLDAIVESANIDPLKLTGEQLKARRAELDKALYHYGMSLRVNADSEAAFREHFANPAYQMHVDMYRSHLEHLVASRTLLAADRDMLEAATATGAARADLVKSARDNYRQALRLFRIIRLRYYTFEGYYLTMLPKGTTRWNLDKSTDQQIEAYLNEVERRNTSQGFDPQEEDNREYKKYIQRAQQRLDMLSRIVGK